MMDESNCISELDIICGRIAFGSMCIRNDRNMMKLHPVGVWFWVCDILEEYACGIVEGSVILYEKLLMSIHEWIEEYNITRI